MRLCIFRGMGFARRGCNTKATLAIKERNNVYNKEKENLESVKIKSVEIHIDWFDDIKCIGIQGRYKEYYMDLQIYPNEFSVSFDLDEPDEDVIYPLESKEQIYSVLSNIVKTL